MAEPQPAASGAARSQQCETNNNSLPQSTFAGPSELQSLEMATKLRPVSPMTINCNSSAKESPSSSPSSSSSASPNSSPSPTSSQSKLEASNELGSPIERDNTNSSTTGPSGISNHTSSEHSDSKYDFSPPLLDQNNQQKLESTPDKRQIKLATKQTKQTNQIQQTSNQPTEFQALNLNADRIKQTDTCKVQVNGASRDTAANNNLEATICIASAPKQNLGLPTGKSYKHQQEANQNYHHLIKAEEFYKQRRLSYLQALLLRRWPCFAISICIMSSLLFGIVLSALTVYLMHGYTDCSGLALAANSPLLPPRDLIGRPADLDSAHDMAALAGGLSDELMGRLLSGSYSTTAASQVDKPRFQRLSSALWPIHYDLFVQPYLYEPFNFTGKVTIHLNCSEPTDNITLHTYELELDESSLDLREIHETTANDSQPSKHKIVGLSQDKPLQYSIIQLGSPLKAGRQYALTINFIGHLNDELAGFYKIQYTRKNSTEISWIAATQFQATDARRAFPCFDEPLYKATFSIQIKHWKNMTALSNMPIKSSQDSPDGLWTTDMFEKSHRMSTYLVAFAVTNFESRSDGNISVWTRPGFVHTAEYALKVAGKILKHYENFFGIEYPLPKMDMIALPDFNAGAMENWGLITYRETAMLYDEASSSISNKQRVAVVVAHELAHQWFGNLVTPKWWDDLWLNEGFASFVEYIGVDHVEPKWRMLEQFVVEEVQAVFKMDGLSSTHQISIPVGNPDEISEIFDHISYAKGASIIRMMNHFLTEEVFKAGLRRYLRALKYGNAEQSDLWTHLTEAQRLYNVKTIANNSSTGQLVDVERVMNSWTLQSGFPLVTLTRQYGNPKPSATLQQVRYRAYELASAKTASETEVSKQNGQRWEIPITFTWKSEQNWQPKTRLWMHQNTSEPVKIDPELLPKSDDDWMLVNVQQVGYYRVNYDLNNWKLLINQLNKDHRMIGTTNRAQILDDIFELAKSGSINYKFAMEATKYLKNEQDFLPWDSVLMAFSYIDDMLSRTPIYGEWKDYTAEIVAPYYARYKNLDWTISKTSKGENASRSVDVGNDVIEQYNQVNAIATACSVDKHCIDKAKAYFAELKKGGENRIYPALRFTVYCNAIEHGDKNDWDYLWSLYEKEQNSSEKDRIMRSLSCSKEIWILSRYLEWTFSKSKPIRRQDGAYVFRMIAKNNYGRDIAFNFMREKWSTIKEYYGKSSFSLGNLIRSVSISMNTQVELNQLKTFYETIKGDVGTGKRSFQIAIDEVESNLLWKNRNYKIIEDWIQSHRSESPVQIV